MPKYELLNKKDHKDLLVARDWGVAYGDNVMATPIFPFEFQAAQSAFPIVFKKNEQENVWYALALFGLENGENLFLKGNRWDAGYVPLTIEARPFLVGFQNQLAEGYENKNTVIHLDADSPRVGVKTGERVFDDDGEPTEYLKRISVVLGDIHAGMEASRDFFSVLENNSLLEAFSGEFLNSDGTKHTLSGFYTVKEDALQNVSNAVLAQLLDSGYLKSIYMVIASLSNFSDLTKRRFS
ncbi:SapC family protein [Saccharophagus degradans]|uniref:SapC n=1 Tax=Saccharophagus degradans (strain 2-40 / ATCC 43961 / DSM 17024) TaxID=203122 RepID=Q21KW8_SACD2|nr:SapC family protein [Saccharophagus degradans]ABD80661.1 SapC [Saccharophagus degradans 2-40]